MPRLTVRFVVDRVSLRRTHDSVTLLPEMPPTGDLRLPPLRFTVAPPGESQRIGLHPDAYVLLDLDLDPDQTPNPQRDGAWEQYQEQAEAAQREQMANHPMAQLFGGSQGPTPILLKLGTDGESAGDSLPEEGSDGE